MTISTSYNFDGFNIKRQETTIRKAIKELPLPQCLILMTYQTTTQLLRWAADAAPIAASGEEVQDEKSLRKGIHHLRLAAATVELLVPIRASDQGSIP